MVKVTRRLVRETGAVVRDGGVRQVIVELEPPAKMIGLRLKGRKRVYFVPLGDLYIATVRRDVEARRRAKESQ